MLGLARRSNDGGNETSRGDAESAARTAAGIGGSGSPSGNDTTEQDEEDGDEEELPLLRQTPIQNDAAGVLGPIGYGAKESRKGQVSAAVAASAVGITNMPIAIANASPYLTLDAMETYLWKFKSKKRDGDTETNGGGNGSTSVGRERADSTNLSIMTTSQRGGSSSHVRGAQHSTHPRTRESIDVQRTPSEIMKMHDAARLELELLYAGHHNNHSHNNSEVETSPGKFQPPPHSVSRPARPESLTFVRRDGE